MIYNKRTSSSPINLRKASLKKLFFNSDQKNELELIRDNEGNHSIWVKTHYRSAQRMRREIVWGETGISQGETQRTGGF